MDYIHINIYQYKLIINLTVEQNLFRPPTQLDQAGDQAITNLLSADRHRRPVHVSDQDSPDGEETRVRPGRLNLNYDVPDLGQHGLDNVDGSPSSANEAPSKRLLEYFVKVNTEMSGGQPSDLKLEHVADLLKQGADLNFRDRYGQTVLHEVAANWHPTVMDRMIDCGGNCNAPDNHGLTPLHVAAATDNAEMCRMLVSRGADKEALSTSQQTPLFFAAKTDSARSLRALLRLGCDKESRDYIGRTPLFAAAELDRSETSAILLEHGADAFVVDSIGQIAYAPLVEKMPPLAKMALEPLYETFRIDRVQRLDLFRLEPIRVRMDPKASEKPLQQGHIACSKLNDAVPFKSAMKTITETTNYLAIKTPIIQEMINVQWISYGRTTAIWQITLQLITIILWTAFAVIKPWAERYTYNLPAEGYRIAILLFAILLTVYSIIDEIHEYLSDRARHKRWQEWRRKRILADIKHCHDGQPEEAEYWEKELKETEEATVEYFQDSWNYLDWICYVFLIASIVTHFIDVGYPGGDGNLVVARWHLRIMAISIVLIWLRLLKYAKPFEFFGPFIVMLGMIAGDLLKFFLLYLEFLVPFSCIFWTILGGESNLKEVDVFQSGTLSNYSAFNLTKVTVTNFDTVNNLLFSVFRLTLVDDYDYANMIAIDPYTAQILLGVWFAVSTILFLNLFIAQLSESFKQVYDNAKAASAMQKAITLTAYYESLMPSSRMQYHNYLEDKCHPMEKPYDDDITDFNAAEELQKATLQIRETMEDIGEKFNDLYEAELCDSDEEEEFKRDAKAKRDPNAPQDEQDTSVGHLCPGRALQASFLTSLKIHYDQLDARVDKLDDLLREELGTIRAILQDLAIVVAASPDLVSRQHGESSA